MLLVLLIALLDRAKPVILCQPTFTVYNLLVRGLGGSTLGVPLTSDLLFDVGAVVEASTKNPGSILIICSPNNPTGSSLTEAQIRRILQVHTGFFIIDQAYIEFGGFNAAPLIREYPNLLVARTVSKAFAAAGLRLGYMIGHADVIAQINKVKLPYNLNFFSIAVVETALKYRDKIAGTIRELRNSRDELIAFLKTMPFERVFPSDANFILIRLSGHARLFQSLKSDGILIRDVSHYPLLENCLRISVGSLDENELLRKSIVRFFSTAQPVQG